MNNASWLVIYFLGKQNTKKYGRHNVQFMQFVNFNNAKSIHNYN